MPLHIIIIITFGIAFSLYGLIAKMIEMTAERTASKIVKKLDLIIHTK